MKQHILVVSQYFYPEDFRINDICKEWVKRGYKVTVLTGFLITHRESSIRDIAGSVEEERLTKEWVLSVFH